MACPLRLFARLHKSRRRFAAADAVPRPRGQNGLLEGVMYYGRDHHRTHYVETKTNQRMLPRNKPSKSEQYGKMK